MRTSLVGTLLALATASSSLAEEPYVSYIFPAGGQQGTQVEFKVGGHYLHGEASFDMLGPGVAASPKVREVETFFFEGPLIPMPASQQKEDYPRDHAGQVTIAADAAVGVRYWHVSTSQGVTPSWRFVIGSLPEIVEVEIDGAPVPKEVTLPVTINGRIFPREDTDIWTINAKTGEIISCSVNAQRLGSALNARLEILDPGGHRLAEAVPVTGKDPSLQWQAPVDGIYAVRIHDIDFGGLQHYVYRLTITKSPHVATTYPLGGKRGSTTRVAILGSDGAAHGDIEFAIPDNATEDFPLLAEPNPVFLRTGDADECLETEPNDSPEHDNDTAVAVPCVLNGRIQAAGDVDYWSLTLGMGEAIDCELLAGTLGSPLFPVMTVYDPAGKEIARSSNPGDPKIEARLHFEAPAAGMYRIAVAEHFAHRGGAHYAYRLSLRPFTGPDFKLTLATNAISVFREIDGLTEEEKMQRPPSPPAKLVVEVQRLAGFDGEIELLATGLPEGVHLANNKIAKGQNKTELTFRADADVRLQATRVTLSGVAEVGESKSKVTRTASAVVARGEPPLNDLLLAVAMTTPFYFTGDYTSFPLPRGSIYRRHYQLHRGGFTGPVYARLADRQVRHLQGVRGPTITVPPDATEFDYEAVMAPCLEIGRTSRSTIMIYGTVTDSDGSEHVVSYTSGDPNHQFIGQMVAGLLSVRPVEPSRSVEPNASIDVPVVISRGQAIKDAAVRVELQLPAHFKGVHATPVTVPAAESSATLTISFGETLETHNMPVKVTATTLGNDDPHVAESPLELVTLSRD
ncbi:MAG: hypothetical protein O3C21_12250 [Verrucomicrobia bacterium]|nr:hypothetical protein [Verrucomicrobiota bacterium]